MSRKVQEQSPSVASVVSSLSLNVFASCGTIFINKHLFDNLGFRFGTTLTVMHFVVTFILCCIAASVGMFKVKRLEMKRVLPISIAFCGYVVFNNISLQYNSVSFYQVMKILCTPLIIFIETYFYNKDIDTRTKISVLPVCFGIFITASTDYQINLIGTVVALVAVVSNTMYTIYGKTKQNELQADAMQILLYQSITSAFILMFFIPVFDDMKGLGEFAFDLSQIAWILFSCLTAFMVNFSFFLLVGKTSPLTYVNLILFFFPIDYNLNRLVYHPGSGAGSVNVVGYLKTVIVFVGGYLLFDAAKQKSMDAKNIFGIIIVLLGVLFYTYVKIDQEQEKSKKRDRV